MVDEEDGRMRVLEVGVDISDVVRLKVDWFLSDPCTPHSTSSGPLSLPPCIPQHLNKPPVSSSVLKSTVHGGAGAIEVGEHVMLKEGRQHTMGMDPMEIARVTRYEAGVKVGKRPGP